MGHLVRFQLQICWHHCCPLDWSSFTVVRILHFLDLRILSTDMVFDKNTQAKDRARGKKNKEKKKQPQTHKNSISGSWDASSRQTKAVYYSYVCSTAASFDLVDDLFFGSNFNLSRHE